MNESTPTAPKSTKPWNDRNQCRFTGRLGADLKIHQTGKSPVVTGTLYVTNEYDSQQGERMKNEARVGFVMYGAEAVAFAQKAGKGDRVELEGRVRGNSWTDKAEQKRYSLELIANATKAAVLVTFVPKDVRTAA